MILASTRLMLLACGYLAEGYYEGKKISAPEIGEKFNINTRALMPALRNLTRAGILSSQVGGRTPGFIFTRNPKDISYLEIISALEGIPRFSCCKQTDPSLICDKCNDMEDCEIYKVFNQLITNATRTLSRMPIVSLK